jgi:membrane fusion protein (multidrug efflux system)
VATADVRPQVDGIIRQRLFKEGSDVHVGQPLYLIDARVYRASRDQIAAQIESAQASLMSAEAKARLPGAQRQSGREPAGY